MNEENNQDEYLNLDISVLTEKTGNVPAIMDKYGIRIFDEEIQRQIEEFSRAELQIEQYYAAHALGPIRKVQDTELKKIRSSVFAETVIQGKNTRQTGKAEGINGMAASLIFTAVLAAVAFWYLKKTGKERERRLADIDNRYDE